MANVLAHNMEGREVGVLGLNGAVFGVEVSEHLIHLAVVVQLANKCQGTQEAKTCSEVLGDGREPWRQKGTGHARQGLIRSPQWKGGGVVFAPTPRDYTIRLNKRERRATFRFVLTSRAQDNELTTVDELKSDEIKTKKFQNVMDNLKIPKALMVLANNDQNTVLSARNIVGVKTSQVDSISVHDILKYDTIVTIKAAVASIGEVYV